jgi:site-specific recombinase XerC
VKYRQRIAQDDGSSKLNRASKFLGRTEDFANIFDVERCRTSFMQIVNRDRLSANSRITITARFRRGSLFALDQRGASSQHQQGTSRNLEQSPSRSPKRSLTTTTLQHIKSVLSTIFTYARNEGAFDGANPVDGVLIPQRAREPGETPAYDLGQVLVDLLPLLAKAWSRPRPSRATAT